MSAVLDVFNDIVTSIQTNVTEIETVGLWNSQFDNEPDETAFNYPAVFIEFATIPWDVTNLNPSRLTAEGNKSKEQKGGESIIILHIGFSHLENETISFPIIDPIIQKVYFAVQGLQGDFYKPLLRLEDRQDVDHDRVIDWQTDFKTMLTQCGEEDPDATLIPGGTLDLEIEPKDLAIDDEKIRTGVC